MSYDVTAEREMSASMQTRICLPIYTRSRCSLSTLDMLSSCLKHLLIVVRLPLNHWSYMTLASTKACSATEDTSTALEDLVRLF